MTIYEIVLDSSYANQSCINRWNYTGSGSSGSISGAQALVAAMGFLPTGEGDTYPADTIFAAIRNLGLTSVVFNQVVAKNIYEPTDFWTGSFVPGTTGIRNIQGEAPFAAHGFRTNRTRSDIARGTKRFVGVPVNSTVGAGVLSEDEVTLADVLATVMTDALTYDSNDANITFTPAVVQKEKYEVPGSDPVRHAYRYYPTLSEQMTHIMQGIDWEPYVTVRSQTSRQYGKGQ